MDYVGAIKYPLKDWKNFLIGFLLGVIWWTLIPLFFIVGYLVEFIKSVLSNGGPPKWNLANIKTFLIKGTSGIAISLVYLLPPLIVGAGGTSLPVSNPLGVALYWISFVLFLIVLFLLPAAIVVYAATENIWKAFDLEETIPLIKSKLFPYVKVYFVTLAAYIIGMVLMIIPGINLLFGGVMFYITLFSYFLFARALQQ